MRLSKNFRLSEFLLSQTAVRNGIDMTPDDHVIANIQRLVTKCLQPLRNETGPIFISSGFRPLVLNTLIGGSRTSAHMRGDAADITIANQSPFDAAELIVGLDLPYDQVIHEFGRWVHIGMSDMLRHEKLTAYRKAGAVRYSEGILKMEDLP